MLRKIVRFLIVPFLILALSACSAQLTPTEPAPSPTATLVPTQAVEPTFTSFPTKPPLSEAEVPRVTVEDAKAALESGAAIIVDVRSADAYATSHIPGAINIQLGEIETDPANLQLDKAQWIITYCT